MPGSRTSDIPMGDAGSRTVGASHEGVRQGLIDTVPLSRAELEHKLNYTQALYDQRFAGIWNVGPRVIGKLPLSSDDRRTADTLIKEARRMLDTLDPAVDTIDVAHLATATAINETLEKAFYSPPDPWKKEDKNHQLTEKEIALVEDVKKNPLTAQENEYLDALHAKSAASAVKAFDKKLDNYTEYGLSNFNCLFAAKLVEMHNDHRERKGKDRLDAKINWKSWKSIRNGLWNRTKEFAFKSSIYFFGIALSRGNNFLTEVDPVTLKRHFNRAFIETEFVGTAIMVAGSMAGFEILKGVGMNPTAASLLGSAITGYGAGYYVYDKLRKDHPHGANTLPKDGALRAAFNVAIRQGTQPKLRSDWSVVREKDRDIEALADKFKLAQAKAEKKRAQAGPAWPKAQEKLDAEKAKMEMEFAIAKKKLELQRDAAAAAVAASDYKAA